MASNEIAEKINSESYITEQTDKRVNYLDWDNYFMAMAFLSAKRSKDPVTQVGACIVNEEKQIVSVGYNGMPTGCSDDVFPWSKDSVDPLERKTFYVCHAEVNAILNRNCYSLKNCTMYVSLFPCNECAKVIIQSGIKSIKYVSDKYAEKKKTQAAKRMFNAAGVTYRSSDVSVNHCTASKANRNAFFDSFPSLTSLTRGFFLSTLAGRQ